MIGVAQHCRYIVFTSMFSNDKAYLEEDIHLATNQFDSWMS